MAALWSQPGMRPNRSAPPGVVIPVLDYLDVRAAAEWLCQAFGFVERLRIGDHRVQLILGGSSLVISDGSSSDDANVRGGHSVLVRDADADAHHANAVRHGARVIRSLADQSYGERQYTADDLGGHRWTFSQTIADVDPSAWGGIAVTPHSPD